MESAKTILAIGAHIGDMELTCGGVLASAALKGHRIVTLALTAGEKGNPPNLSVAEYRKQKVQEATDFAKALGGEAIVLDNPDGLLAYTEENLWQICDIIRTVKPNILITHWKNSVHKDHAMTHRLVSEARYFASNAGFERALPAFPVSHMLFAENWEDTEDFRPYLYLDTSAGNALWEKEVAKHWFVTHSTDYRYLEYYKALSICRGCESGYAHAQAFMLRPLRDRLCHESVTDLL